MKNDLSVFSDVEKLVIELADEMVNTPSNISDELYARLREKFSEEQLLQLRLHLRIQIFEALAAVTDHRRAERLERLVAHFDRAWDVQFYVRHKRREIFRRTHPTQAGVCPCDEIPSHIGAAPVRFACRYEHVAGGKTTA